MLLLYCCGVVGINALMVLRCVVAFRSCRCAVVLFICYAIDGFVLRYRCFVAVLALRCVGVLVFCHVLCCYCWCAVGVLLLCCCVCVVLL